MRSLHRTAQLVRLLVGCEQLPRPLSPHLATLHHTRHKQELAVRLFTTCTIYLVHQIRGCLHRCAPAPAVDFLPFPAQRDGVLRAANNSADFSLQQSVHGLRLRALLCVAVPQLPILTPSPREHHPRACVSRWVRHANLVLAYRLACQATVLQLADLNASAPVIYCAALCCNSACPLQERRGCNQGASITCC